MPADYNVATAALCNGTAAHGEDYDDTFEGGPVHAGAVIIPALLAAAEHIGFPARDLARGIAVGCEVMCRLCLPAPQARPQGRIPSDRSVRCAGRGGRRCHGAATR